MKRCVCCVAAGSVLVALVAFLTTPVRSTAQNNTAAQEYKGHSDWVLTTCFQPTTSAEETHRYVASGAFDGEVRIWNIADAAIVRQWIANPSKGVRSH